MNDDKVLMALYENRKQFLVVNYRVHGDKCGVSESYIYAISHDMYPFFSQEYSLEGDNQDPYAQCYKISAEDISEILEYVDSEWLKGNVYDYYALESYFGSKATRWKLICILRYCFLDGRFDENLWSKLVDSAPVEAKSITRDLAEWEI